MSHDIGVGDSDRKPLRLTPFGLRPLPPNIRESTEVFVGSMNDPYLTVKMILAVIYSACARTGVRMGHRPRVGEGSHRGLVTPMQAMTA